jgi:hypothetical protein
MKWVGVTVATTRPNTGVAFFKFYRFDVAAKKSWSGKRDSNPRPLAWEANALPTELLPLIANSTANLVEYFDWQTAKPTLRPTLPYCIQAASAHMVIMT